MTIPFKNLYILPEYLADGVNNDIVDIYAQAYVGNSLLSILGSYWSTYYKDIDTLHQLSGAVTPLIGAEYRIVLNQVLSSSIIDTPVHHTKQYELFAFNSADAVYSYLDEEETQLEYIEFAYDGLEDIQYLSSGLFNAGVILDKGNYFEITDGHIRFYVDIFHDYTIKSEAYVFETTELPTAQVLVTLLWATDITITETYLYDRFGRYLYTQQNNSEGYKSVLTALQYFFTTTKSVQNLENILNILFNLPFARSSGELVTNIETLNAAGDIIEGIVDYDANALADSPEDLTRFGWYYRVTTTQNMYFAPMYTELLVEVGQTLSHYQLICKAHSANDYITDSDWYADAKFPFELVEALDDYTVLTTPPEFESYVPHFCDGSIVHDGTYRYTGEYATYIGIDPFLGTRSKSDAEGGTEFEQLLYGMMDSILKYNLLYLYTELNHENVQYYLDSQIREAYSAIAAGVPSYLYPVIETLFKSEMVEKFDDLEGAFELEAVQALDPDLVMVCPLRSYNGVVGFSSPIAYTYSGEYNYGLDAPRCYPYGGVTGDFYDCETEYSEVAITAVDSEALNVLGFGDTPTFPRAQVYNYYNALFDANGVATFTSYTEDVEVDSVVVAQVASDHIDFTESEIGVAQLTTPEYMGSHWGEVSFNNLRWIKAGEGFATATPYSGSSLANGSISFGWVIDPDKVVLFDGTLTYSSFTDVVYTYGSNLPYGINIEDTLGNIDQTLIQEEEVTTPEEVLSVGAISKPMDDAWDEIESTTILTPTLYSEEYTGACYGAVSYNNTSPLLSGDGFVSNTPYDGSTIAGGLASFGVSIIPDKVVLFDGSDAYCGYTDVLYTYGSNLPPNINMHDDLEITLTYRTE